MDNVGKRYTFKVWGQSWQVQVRMYKLESYWNHQWSYLQNKEVCEPLPLDMFGDSFNLGHKHLDELVLKEFELR